MSSVVFLAIIISNDLIKAIRNIIENIRNNISHKNITKLVFLGPNMVQKKLKSVKLFDFKLHKKKEE